MKFKLSPAQYAFYEAQPNTSHLMTRLIREFQLSYATARKMMEQLQSDGMDSVFDLLPGSDDVVIPAHDNDTRKVFYLPSTEYEWLMNRLEDAVGGPYYENLSVLTTSARDDILREYEAEFYPSRLTQSDQVKFDILSRQFFLGMRTLDVSISSGTEDLLAWLRQHISQGVSPHAAIALLFRSVSEEAHPVHLATAYNAVAEILYDEIEKLIDEHQSSE